MENKYKTLKEFKKDYPSEYSSLYNKKLLDKLCEDMGWDTFKTRKPITYRVPKFHWDIKENCVEEAKKYNTRTEWARNSCVSYKKALKNEWFEECIAHMVEVIKPPNYWTKEKCLESALIFTNRTEWGKKIGGAVCSAKENGWYKECTAHMIETRKPAGYWTKEHCMENALKYEYKTDWWKYSNGSYNSAKNNGWLEECVVHMKIKKINGK